MAVQSASARPTATRRSTVTNTNAAVVVTFVGLPGRLSMIQWCIWRDCFMLPSPWCRSVYIAVICVQQCKDMYFTRVPASNPFISRMLETSGRVLITVPLHLCEWVYECVWVCMCAPVCVIFVFLSFHCEMSELLWHPCLVLFPYGEGRRRKEKEGEGRREKEGEEKRRRRNESETQRDTARENDRMLIHHQLTHLNVIIVIIIGATWNNLPVARRSAGAKEK